MPNRRPLPDPWDCPEAIGKHGPADRAGRCPWCGRRYTAAQPAPPAGWGEPSELTDAYGQAYDPDWGALTPAEIAYRYRTGLT